MQISAEGTIGIFLALLGLGGGGALFVLPHPYADYAGWSLIGVSVLGLILLGAYHFKIRIGRLLLWLRRPKPAKPVGARTLYPAERIGFQWKLLEAKLDEYIDRGYGQGSHRWSDPHTKIGRLQRGTIGSETAKMLMILYELAKKAQAFNAHISESDAAQYEARANTAIQRLGMSREDQNRLPVPADWPKPEM